MIRLTDILDKVKGYHPEADTDLINKAFVYSARMHEGQMRKSGDPYFVHPVAVADIIADMRLDAASVCAALLHDVVEDTKVTSNEIEGAFGQEVAFLVDGVTKLGKVNFSCREDQQAESFRKMLVAMARDIRVLLVKLADRLDNMRTLEHMRADSQERISRETVEIYAPLAGRLGIQWLKAELEDLSFQYLWPDAFLDLNSQMERRTKDSDRYVSQVIKKLQHMLIQRGFAVEVFGRHKHLYSVFSKMRKTDCEFEQVHDVTAFRVLVETVADCYAALGVVHSEWTPVPGRFKDYIALPKSNMYQSLHTTVIGPEHRRIEVQIRTHDMHRTAEYGIAAHWQYKQRTGGLDAKDAARFAWLRQLMEFQQEVNDPAEFYESVRVDLFNDEIFVFTPKGDVKNFPQGATPIDFAYSIHSEVGHHCAGARVNGAMVSMRTQLRNGDVVDILTSNNQRPNKDQLEHVVTARARSRIRTYLRSEERRRSVKLGRDLFERQMRKRELSYARFLKSPESQKVVEKLGCKNTEELFAQLGYGRIDMSDVMEAIVPADKPATQENLKPGLIERTVNRVRRRPSDNCILIQGMDDMLVRFGKCCNPVPGDSVTGWITRGRGVTVHRRGCPRAMELDPDRRVDVEWARTSNVDLPVSLRVTTGDRPGLLSKISNVFTTHGVNINEASCRSLSGRGQNVFQFTVRDLNTLKSLMRGIQKVEGVYDVERE
ncbi:MAG: bifunctional (p)ppGpp synthetase/guanosine-3',5'-bis(diphosphate) 3'-pyrophosphohydrolase [Myxococcota bacterium]